MAQLVKLEDYISRYEVNIYHYTNLFINLKRKRWVQTKSDWEWFQGGHVAHVVSSDLNVSVGWNQDAVKTRHPLCHVYNLVELEDYFSENMFNAQIKWATSTLEEKSIMSDRYKNDRFLKQILEQFPDTFLLLYEPVIMIKQAPVQLDIILLTPSRAWCIKCVIGEEDSVFRGHSKHVWQEMTSAGSRKKINPILSLERTSGVLEGILKQENSQIPVHRCIYAPESYIEFVDAPKGIEIIDRRTAKQWFDELGNQRSSMKHTQLKAGQALLKHCSTVADKRI